MCSWAVNTGHALLECTNLTAFLENSGFLFQTFLTALKENVFPNLQDEIHRNPGFNAMLSIQCWGTSSSSSSFSRPQLWRRPSWRCLQLHCSSDRDGSKGLPDSGLSTSALQEHITCYNGNYTAAMVMLVLQKRSKLRWSFPGAVISWWPAWTSSSREAPSHTVSFS